MKLIGLLLLALFFVATPAVMLDQLVMPQLTALQQSYSTYDAKAQAVVRAK